MGPCVCGSASLDSAYLKPFSSLVSAIEKTHIFGCTQFKSMLVKGQQQLVPSVGQENSKGILRHLLTVKR